LQELASQYNSTILLWTLATTSKQGNTMTTKKESDHELGEEQGPLKRSASTNEEPKIIEVDADSSQDIATNVSPTLAQSLPHKELCTPEEGQAKMQAVSGGTSSTTRQLLIDSGLKKHGLHRSKDELQARLDASPRGKRTATSQDLPSSTMAQSLPSKGLHRTLEGRQAKLKAITGGTSSTTRNFQLDSACNKHGLHRTPEERQAKLDAASGKRTATSQDLPSSTVAQSLPLKGLHRTPEERQAKLKAITGGTSSTTRNFQLDSACNKHGLHRTPEERQAKLDAARGKLNATSQDFPVSTVPQPVPHQGLRRTSQERQAKMQAVSGRTTSTVRKDNKNSVSQKNTGRAKDPPGWVKDSFILDEDNFQESLAVMADLNQDNDRSDGRHSPTAEVPTVGQYLESNTPGIAPPPTWQPPVTTRLHYGVMDTGLATNGSNFGLVEARAVADESTILPRAQQVDANQLARNLEFTTIREQKEKECLRVGYCIISVALVVLAISLGVGLGTRKSNMSTVPTVSPSTTPSFVPSSAPTGHLDLLHDILPRHTRESLQNYSTPQWKALDWLSNHQNITKLPLWRMKQLFAMATFFYAFEGENWPDLMQRAWMDDKVDECLWFNGKYGIFDNGQYEEELSIFPDPCNNNGEFQSLVLANLELSNLNPSIPPEITLLSSLLVFSVIWSNISTQFTDMLEPLLTNITNLQLHLNSISGSLPSDLGIMTDMELLSLSENSLVGILPSELGLMTKLKVLSLNYNSFSGSLPSEMGRMMDMTDLGIYENSLVGLLPSELGRMTKMMAIDLGANSFSGSIPSELGRMTNLTSLLLDENSLVGLLPSELGLLTRLTSLYLPSNSLSGSLPSKLGEMTNISDLSLGNNFFSGTIPSSLGRLTNMVLLDLSALSMLAGSIPSELTLLTSLRHFNLSGSRGLSGSIPVELCFLQDSSPCFFLDSWGDNYSCYLDFDCTDLLCGCDCPCVNGTVSNDTEGLTILPMANASQ
jgi:hypothetical protein